MFLFLCEHTIISKLLLILLQISNLLGNVWKQSHKTLGKQVFWIYVSIQYIMPFQQIAITHFM